MRFERHHFQLEQSVITFLCQTEFLQVGREAVSHIRQDLEKYIKNHPEFETSHTPLSPAANAPEIVKEMCTAAEKIKVGPMASVAGAVALAALQAILEKGAKEAIVDNGGDIAFYIQEPVSVGIFAGFNRVRDLALEVLPKDGTFGICTSSGSVGPSFSYGKCDAAVVISQDVLLSDAAATALGNHISTESDLHSAFSIFDEIPEIEGAFAIFNDQIGLWGNIPQLKRQNVDYEIITKGR